ncbi:MAG: tRNA uridine-5-carboxymethylaminomethyl(34) synthesis enzyme MnmG [Puniceicoccales bacterium]|nr:tRNA uridine-5-carboxymethylaminomethyl(34) synthesis enzyme MnmG [Puniceicoccales bacterium]
MWDVIVVGGGHGGCEAAAAAARLSMETLLITGNLETIGQMSCNPAIGGLAKGHMVREIDALGGLMGENADATALHFRLLNRSRGAAVQGLRVQCDMRLYAGRMRFALERMANLSIFQAIADGISPQSDGTLLLETNLGIALRGRAIVLATGTFLRGRMHVGSRQWDGGRLGDFSSVKLPLSLNALSIGTERMKTGTSARLLGRTVDFASMERQDGDACPAHFAFYDTRGEEDCTNWPRLFSTDALRDPARQLPCFLCSTGAETRTIVEENLHLAATHSGAIGGRGPRYCPSIEDKFVKFPAHRSHRLFIEPEGIGTDEYYVNGLSTSMPFAVQESLVRSVEGLGHAHITKPAYAVEYDYVPPTQLLPSLETKALSGLFCAGQINGTSGYEEAAAQGLIAGINAAAKVKGIEPLVLGRHEAYIGVLIDDLVTKGADEPYRMFTGRAEFRLLLNGASAELRLLEVAERYGLLGEERLKKIRLKRERVERAVKNAESAGELSEAEAEEVAYRNGYAGYWKRERKQMERLCAVGDVQIPPAFDYGSIGGLANESRQKLEAVRPGTLGQARRICGVGDVAVELVRVALARHAQGDGDSRG